MADASPTHGTIWEDAGAMLMARVTGNDGAAITQASLSTITYKVFDLKTEVSTGSLTISSVVFDTLQTDARWTVDSTGYNFRWDAPASLFTTSGHQYRVEIRFTPASGAIFWAIFDLFTIAVLTS